MADKRVARRFKERREALGLTQEELAERADVAPHFISTIERGTAFPRFDKMIALINALESSADAIFCDVIDNSSGYRASILSEMIGTLPAGEQKRILDVVELMIRQAKEQEH